MTKQFLIVAMTLMMVVQGVSGLAQDTLFPIPDVVQSAKWHPRGEGLLVTGRGGPDVWGLWLYDVDLQPVRFFQFESSVSADWSPDGTRLSMGRNIVDAQTLEVLVSLEANSGIGGWSPDGTQVLAWVDEANLGLFNSQTGALERRISVGETIPDYVSWSPDGRLFAFLLPTGEANIINSDTGQIISTLPMMYPLGFRWSPDSSMIAAGFIEEVPPDTPNLLPDALGSILASLRVFDVGTGELRYEDAGMVSWAATLRWNADSTEIIGVSPIGIIFAWDLESNSRQVFGILGSLGPIDYSPYQGRLVIGANTLRQQSNTGIRQKYVPDTEYWSQPLVPNALEIIVLNPSLDRLASIAQLCARDATTQTRAVADLAASTPADLTGLPAFVAQVEALPEGAIPPACAADLLAVAAALGER